MRTVPATTIYIESPLSPFSKRWVPCGTDCGFITATSASKSSREIGVNKGACFNCSAMSINSLLTTTNANSESMGFLYGGWQNGYVCALNLPCSEHAALLRGQEA